MKVQLAKNSEKKDSQIPLKAVDFEKLIKTYEEKLDDLRGCLWPRRPEKEAFTYRRCSSKRWRFPQ